MPAKKKRAYHHGDLRRTLLEASLELIREDGLDALSLREVARRAGVSPGAPYHHFESRERLLTALALDGFSLLGAAMQSARDAARDADAIERFSAIGEAYVRFALTHPAHFRLMFRPSLVPSRDLPRDGSPGEAFGVLIDMVSELFDTGVIGAHVERSGFVLLAWSVVHGAAELLLDGPLADGHAGLDVSASDVPALVTRTFGILLQTGMPRPPVS
jgi:AcrR family transcriptional regulator